MIMKTKDFLIHTALSRASVKAIAYHYHSESGERHKRGSGGRKPAKNESTI